MSVIQESKYAKLEIIQWTFDRCDVVNALTEYINNHFKFKIVTSNVGCEILDDGSAIVIQKTEGVE